MTSEGGGDASAQVVLMVIQDDIRHVHIRATASMAIAAVFVTQIPLDELQALPVGFGLCTLVGIVALGLAAIFNFVYTHQLNLMRIRIARALADGDAAAEIERWVEDFSAPWWRMDKPIRWYGPAQALFLGGAILLVLVIGVLLFS